MLGKVVWHDLPWEEAKDMEALFCGHDNFAIFLELDKMHKAGRLPSQRFAKALTEFYWQFI